MAYINTIALDNETHLIEPTLYTDATFTANTAQYSASLTNFAIDTNNEPAPTGVMIQVKIPNNSPANASLKVNTANNIAIKYEGASITANQLKANHIYNLVYDGSYWQIVGDINTQENYGNITTSGTLGSGDNLVVTSDGTIQAGATISSAIASQDTTTGFLREDGVFQAPPYPVTSVATLTGAITKLDLLNILGLQPTTNNQILIGTTSNGNLIPTWTISATLSSQTSTDANTDAWDILSLGNNASVTTTTAHSQGMIKLFSSGTKYTAITSQSTSADQIFYLPQYEGSMYAVHASSNTAVGNGTQPVYIAANGRVTETTYELKATINASSYANRLAYYSSTTALSATNHYASTTAVTIGDTDAPDNSGIFQVNGLSTMQSIFPDTNNAYDLGSTSLRWKDIYLTNSLILGTTSYTIQNSSAAGIYMAPGTITLANTSVGNGLYLYNEGVQYAQLYTATQGAVNNDGQVYLILGNEINTELASNAYGIVRLWSKGTTYTDICSQPGFSKIFYLPNYNDNMYAVHTGSTAAVGGTNQPVYVNANGRVTSTTYALNATVNASDYANRLAYYETTTELSGGNIITDGTYLSNINYLTVNDNTQDTYRLKVTGPTYFNGNVTHNGITYFANNTTYYIDNDAIGYLSDLRVDKIRIDEQKISFYPNNNATTINNAPVNGYIEIDTNTHMHFNSVTALFDFDGSLIPTTTNIYDLGDTTNRWKNLYLQDNLVMQDIGIPNPFASTISNKITWSGNNESAEIYYSLIDTNSSRLVLNTTIPTANTNTDANCQIAFAHNDNISICLDAENISFYPIIPSGSTSAGSLGLSTNRWSTLYIGNSNTYGDAYTPIYWNNGKPEIVYPIQYFTWTISQGKTGVKLEGNNTIPEIFQDNTYNITLVVTSGEEHLKAPLTWESSTNPYIFTITTTAAVTGAVNGYAIVARGINITGSLTSTPLPISTT